MKDKKSKMSITMYFSYGLLALALIFILLTKKDEKTTDDCHMPTHLHKEELQEMEGVKVANKIE